MVAMICLAFVQYMKHSMQIMQKHSEYDLMTNSVNFLQQLTSALSKRDTSVCKIVTNAYCDVA